MLFALTMGAPLGHTPKLIRTRDILQTYSLQISHRAAARTPTQTMLLAIGIGINIY